MIPAGTVVGEVIGITRTTQTTQRRLVGALAGLTLLPQLAFLAAPGFAAALALLFVSGLGSAYVLGLDGLVLDAAPAELRGRVLSLNTTGLMTLQGLGFGLAGVAGEALPLHAVVAGSAALGLVAVLRLSPRAHGAVFGTRGASPRVRSCNGALNNLAGGLAERRERRQLRPVADRPPRSHPADAAAGPGDQLRPRTARARRRGPRSTHSARRCESHRAGKVTATPGPGLPRSPARRHRRLDRAARHARSQLRAVPARGGRRRLRLRRAARAAAAGRPALEQLTERGLVHEVWLLADHTDHSAPWETVEVKRTYDEAFRPLASPHHAGNSGEHTAPWIGRSLRILFVNFARGVGCAMESLGHSLERMAMCGALPYYERYFREYAMLDLDRRYGLPFESLYLKGPHNVEYPGPSTLQLSPRLAQAPGRGLRPRRRQRALHAQRPLRLRPGRCGPGPLDDRDLAQAGQEPAPVDAGRPGPLPRRRPRLHGPLGRLLAAEHAGPGQSRSTTPAAR